MNLKGKSKICKNLDCEIIVVSDDKAKLKLIEYQNVLVSRRDWIAPLTTGVSLLATIVAVDKFQNVFFFSAAVWEAIFKIGLALTFIWFVITLVRIYKNRDKGGIDELIDQLKGESVGLEVEKKGVSVEKFSNVIFEAKRKIQEKKDKSNE